MDYPDFFAQQEDVHTACDSLAIGVDQATLCLCHIFECDFYCLRDHATFRVSRTALSVFQEYSETPSHQHTPSLSRAFERLHDILDSFSAYSTSIDELYSFSEELVYLHTLPTPDAADYVAVFNASLSLFSFVRERSLRNTMRHTFFFNAELAIERFALLFIQEDRVLEAVHSDSFMNFRLAMNKFSVWRDRYRFEAQVASCLRVLEDTLRNPCPSSATIVHALLRTRSSITNVLRLTEPDMSHVTLANLAPYLVRRLCDQMLSRTRQDIDPQLINELIDCLSLFRDHFLIEGSLAEDAAPYFQSILEHDSGCLNHVPVHTLARDDHDFPPQGFIPNSVRLKNPINSSKNYKDDEQIRKEEEETQREHEEWQAKMAARAKKRAQLEIDLRIEDLKRLSTGSLLTSPRRGTQSTASTVTLKQQLPPDPFRKANSATWLFTK